MCSLFKSFPRRKEVSGSKQGNHSFRMCNTSICFHGLGTLKCRPASSGLYPYNRNFCFAISHPRVRTPCQRKVASRLLIQSKLVKVHALRPESRLDYPNPEPDMITLNS